MAAHALPVVDQGLGNTSWLVDLGDEADLGGLTLRALATPGHTDEHLAFLLLDGTRPLGVFTGGSLIVGAAARTDLVDPDRTEELARAQWRSLQRLAMLPDDVAVWPTHGAGSFCSAPPGAARSSTIGDERAHNPLLRAGSEDAFVRALLAGLGDYPSYFRHLGALNRRGPEPLPTGPHLESVSAHDVAAALARGAVVVDVRPVQAYATAHLPGSLSIPLRPAFATWLGWTASPGTALLFVRETGQDPDEIAWGACKVGFDRRLGELAGGLPAWRDAGLPVRSTPLLDASALSGRTVIDVRQRSEFGSGHLPGATNVELGRLAEGYLPEVPDGTAVMCGHGERAMTAASLLERGGQEGVSVVLGGPDEWASHSGQPLTVAP